MEDRTVRLGLTGGLDAVLKMPPDAPELGREPVCRLLREWLDALGGAIRNLNAGPHPNVICIGGGGAAAVPTLLERLIARESLARNRDTRQLGAVVKPSSLGDDAGIIGAADIASCIAKGCPPI